MDKRIEKFIKRHHVMSLATTTAEGQPWVSQMFYAYDPVQRILVFTSSDQTRHMIEALENGKVAVSIVLESKLIARLQGVQIEGDMIIGSDELKGVFSSRWPMIPLKDGTIHGVRIRTAKYTDNTLGFGTKIFYPEKTSERIDSERTE